MATVYRRGGQRNRGGRYYISYFDHTGQRITRSARTNDKSTAERIAAKLESEAALRRDRVIDPTVDNIQRESQRTIESHLTDYEAKMRAANRCDKHIGCTLQWIRSVAESAEFTSVASIGADGVTRYASNLRNQGRSARTIQAHLTAIKGFTKWLTENHKLPRDPLISIRKPSPRTDRRRERRMLLPEEWQWLATTTASGPERFGVPAAERVLLYRTAIQTGLRSGELRSLTGRQLHLDVASPFVLCRAMSAKNRREARQHIPRDLADALARHVEEKAITSPVFAMPHESNVARMLREDLDAAREAWLNEARTDADEYRRRERSDFLAGQSASGEVVDFHCLRHTCGAWLARAGVHPKVVQTIMRHSTITLTMDTYGHLFPGQEADAIVRLQELMYAPADDTATRRNRPR